MIDHDAVMWVFTNYIELSHGLWPDPETSEGKKPGVSARASFESPAIMAAEIGRRVQMCGQDGLVVENLYGMISDKAWDLHYFSVKYRIPLEVVQRIVNKVSWYCTDEEFTRKLPYHIWKRKTKYEQKMRVLRR